MAHTYEELKHMTVAQMRDIAAGNEHEALQGYTQLRKAELLEALCTALGIEAHEHHEVIGIDKRAIKGQIRELKSKRDELLAAGEKADYKKTLRRIHGLKHRLRKAMV